MVGISYIAPYQTNTSQGGGKETLRRLHDSSPPPYFGKEGAGSWWSLVAKHSLGVNGQFPTTSSWRNYGGLLSLVVSLHPGMWGFGMVRYSQFQNGASSF